MSIAANVARTLFHTTVIFFVVWAGATVCRGQSAADRKVDIGGRRLHLSVAGAGSATVVFESGLGEPGQSWNDVQPAIARFARTVVYDRAGIGQSDPAKRPTTTASMVEDLHSLLHAARIAPPYILVGHSLGGTLAQVFAHTYPKEVAGLVLVDPEGAKLIDRLHAHMTPDDWKVRQQAIDESMPRMPPAVRAEMETLSKEVSVEDEVLPLPNVPVILLTGTKKNPEFPGNPLEQDLKLELHNELLARIPGSKHVLAPDSRHYIQNDSPQLVINAVRDIVDRSAAR